MMASPSLSPHGHTFYAAALDLLIRSGIPFLVGGAYAVERFTGIKRDTKDLDVFVHPADCERALQRFAEEGYRTELKFPHWLGKVLSGDETLDIIFSSGNGIAEVDGAWFEHAVEGTVLDRPVSLCPPEEMIWSKAFIMERERYDGADVAHLIRACADHLDWRRLVLRFGPFWRVLLNHLVLFGFIYPGERDRVPAPVLQTLLRRLQQETATPPRDGQVCRGTLLSRAQYVVDVECWGYRDARLSLGTMTEEDVATWTAAIEGDLPRPGTA